MKKDDRDANGQGTQPASHDIVQIAINVAMQTKVPPSISSLASCLQCKDLSNEERKTLKGMAVTRISNTSEHDFNLDARTRKNRIADTEYLLGVLKEDPENKQLVESKEKMLKGVKEKIIKQKC